MMMITMMTNEWMIAHITFEERQTEENRGREKHPNAAQTTSIPYMLCWVSPYVPGASIKD